MSIRACHPSHVAKSCIKGAKQVGKHLRPVVGVYASIVDTTRAFAEMAIPLTPGAASFNHTFAPLRIGSLFYAPFDAARIGRSINQVVKAPSYLKFLPILRMGVSFGNLLDNACTGIWICAHMGVNGALTLSTVTLGVGGAAVGLQALGIAISLWTIHEINEQWEAVEQALGNKNDYDAAVKAMTAEPKTKNKIWRQKFFGVLSKSHKVAIEAIYNKYKAGEVKEAQMAEMMESIKKHHFSQKRQQWVVIALLTLGIVGITLTAFGPVSAMPIAWGFVGIAGAGSLALLVYGIYQQRAFKKKLDSLK